MHLLAKATKLFHKPSTTGAHSAPPPKAMPTGSPRIAPGLKIDRRGREPKGLRAPPPPPPTLFIGDLGNRWSDVQACLQPIEDLKFSDDGIIAAVTRLGEGALDHVAQAIGILVAEGQLKEACKLMAMVRVECWPALLERCSADVMALSKCRDADVVKALNRALYVAGRHALSGPDFSRFLALLPACSPETESRLQELFPPLTIDMVRAFDETMLVKAMDVAVGQIRKMDKLEKCLAELDALLEIAGKLEGPDLPRGVVMKCIIWKSLGMGGVPDPVVLGKLQQMQFKTLLPALTPTLLERLPKEFRRAAPCVVQEQGAMFQDFKEGLYRLPETPVYESNGFRDALVADDLKTAARLIHGSTDADFRAEASEKLFAVVSQKLFEGFAQENDRKDAVATKQEVLLKHEMAAVLAMTGEPSLTGYVQAILSQVDAEPGQFIQVLLEKLGYPPEGDPLSQMIEALPRLCNDRPFALNFILKTDQGRRLVTQALMNGLSKQRYGPAALAAVVMALDERIDLQPIFLKEIGQDKWISELKIPAMMAAVIDLLTSGVPRGAEAAEKILTLTQESKVARKALRAQMRDLLPALCDGDHVIELAFVLKTKLGERLVAQAVEDYLMLAPELNNATIFSLFKALAHRVDLRTTELFSIDAEWYLEDFRRTTPTVRTLLERLENAQLGPPEQLVKECTQDLDQWRAGWRLLLLPCLHIDLLSLQFTAGILSVFSAKAFDAAATDGGAGGAKERMNLPLLNWRKPLESLAVMLNTDVAGQPLLSDEALVNVMRAILSDEDLAKNTLDWVVGLEDWPNQKRLYKAMASALVNLQAEASPSRFDSQLRANHAVAGTAALMESTMDPVLKRSFQNEEWWKRFLSRGRVPNELVASGS